MGGKEGEGRPTYTSGRGNKDVAPMGGGTLEVTTANPMAIDLLSFIVLMPKTKALLHGTFFRWAGVSGN